MKFLDIRTKHFLYQEDEVDEETQIGKNIRLIIYYENGSLVPCKNSGAHDAIMCDDKCLVFEVDENNRPLMDRPRNEDVFLASKIIDPQNIDMILIPHKKNPYDTPLGRKAEFEELKVMQNEKKRTSKPLAKKIG